MSIAVVTDSTAYLPADLAERHHITVVPLTVTLSGRSGREGSEITPADVARALATRGEHVTTSRPSAELFASTYRELLDGGAAGVVSVHLAAGLSGTVDAATVAAAAFGDRVTVVDAGSAAMGVGFPAVAAASAAASGQDQTCVRDAALAAAARTSTLFYVDTLEHLRRGGRMGAASALLGTALAVKPILDIAGGTVRVREKVRTAGRALARLVDLAVEASGDGQVDVVVHHLVAADRAEGVARAVRERLGHRLRSLLVGEVGAVVGAHAGPGLVGIVVHRAE
ncbi:DegV family protein [Luedemannella helvata]|uniref:DegV family protein n=1 Tax=Luedemannella helvata TaxID=349315 RepID=A0ABP4WQD1_9ACTN